MLQSFRFADKHQILNPIHQYLNVLTFHLLTIHTFENTDFKQFIKKLTFSQNVNFFCPSLEIVSFLNTKGGEIHLGVNDEGIIDSNLIQSKKREWEQILSNWVVNAFSGDVTNLIHIFPNEEPFKIKILEGKNKPYYYKDGEGFNSKGVFIRVGSTKRVASDDEFQRMIRQHSSNDFESIKIERDDLTLST
ncbi:AlbA family DNA-binding domain-containing protein [Mycoplasma zalophi]|uniref:AlbA family DNA-binding domain-containing protein n=1 Tax=Mycoplasma zalophi TaxID=191287 RepID=UPI001FEDBC2A|nr:ATP-binding protein [Mycoplasma zalophi]